MKKSKIIASAIIGVALVGAVFFSMSIMPNMPKSIVPNSVTASAHSEKEYEKLNRKVQKKNVEMIKNIVADPRVTDDIACGPFFRFIGGNKDSKERNSIRRYIASNLGIKNSADIEIILNRAEQFTSVSNQIWTDAGNFARSNGNKQPLRQFGLAKSKLTKDVLKDLRRNLSRDGWNAFQSAIITKVKPRIKLDRKRGQ